MNNIKRKIWDFPWSFSEGFFIAFSSILLSFAVQYFSVSQYFMPVFPANAAIIVFLFAAIICVNIFFKNNKIIVWLASIYSAVPAISAIFFLVLLMGLIKQENNEIEFFDKTGLANITQSLAFAMSMLFLLITLGFSFAKRLLPFKKTNIAFLLNHLGLWLVLAAGLAGSSDTLRLKMNLTEGGIPTQIATYEHTEYKLPVAVSLIDFKIDEYRAKLAFANNKTGKIIVNDKNFPITLIEQGKSFICQNKKYEIAEYHENSVKFDEKYIKFNETGASPSVEVNITDLSTDQTETKWISCGSYMFGPMFAKINENYSLIMTSPEVKKYSSQIVVINSENTIDTVTLEVNKPYKISGWKIYQLSFNSTKGKWSDTSTLELVKDPWQPLVYLGFFMILAGSISMLWKGKKRINK